MSTPKVMRLLNASTGLMECRVCGDVHLADLRSGGHYRRGSWQCSHGCKLSDLAEKPIEPIQSNT